MNSTFLLGNLTSDPELKSVGANNSSLCTFSIAVNERTKAGEKVYFFNCKAWSKTAENIAKYFRKGGTILIEGSLEQERWEDEGKKRSRVIVRVQSFDFVGNKETTQNTNESSGEDW